MHKLGNIWVLEEGLNGGVGVGQFCLGQEGMNLSVTDTVQLGLDGHFKFPHLWPVKFPCQDVRFNYASFNLIREAASFIL